MPSRRACRLACEKALGRQVHDDLRISPAYCQADGNKLVEANRYSIPQTKRIRAVSAWDRDC